MSFDPENFDDLMGLYNAKQNEKSLELQKQILQIQKLQVLNQTRIAKGLKPLSRLPYSEPAEDAPIKQNALGNIVFYIVLIPLILIVLALLYQALTGEKILVK